MVFGKKVPSPPQTLIKPESSCFVWVVFTNSGADISLWYQPMSFRTPIKGSTRFP